jgi:hypothetical protein
MLRVDTPQGRCLMGVARDDITPPVGIYHRMWGAATHDRSTGVHRPLTATAVCFRSFDGNEQVLVALDHCLLWGVEMESLLAAVCGDTGLSVDCLTVAFSHTHGAGLMGRERAALPGGDLIAPYLTSLAATASRLVHEARGSLRPVTLLAATGRCDLSAHRDLWDAASSQYVCGFNPDGPADDTVLVARAVEDSGRPVATFVNYACHPTTLAWQNTLVSPDYPGALREVVEGATGVPCIFLQGASGDLGPREGFVGDPAVADRNGRQLGYAVLSALEKMPAPGTTFVYTGPVVSGATIGTWAHQPLAEDAAAAKSSWWRSRNEVDLPYRDDMPTADQAASERVRWQSEEEVATRAGDAVRARDCRAMAERMTRWLTRLAVLPPGRTFPLPVTLWQTGDVVWVAVEGEHYQTLQQSLRQRFPGVPLFVITLANGSRVAYLTPREFYGKGIYQESIAVLAPGCLETLVEHVVAVLGKALPCKAGVAAAYRVE